MVVLGSDLAAFTKWAISSPLLEDQPEGALSSFTYQKKSFEQPGRSMSCVFPANSIWGPSEPPSISTNLTFAIPCSYNLEEKKKKKKKEKHLSAGLCI